LVFLSGMGKIDKVSSKIIVFLFMELYINKIYLMYMV
jgi:hypothetical protein